MSDEGEKPHLRRKSQGSEIKMKKIFKLRKSKKESLFNNFFSDTTK
jgi:hypothetical protein